MPLMKDMPHSINDAVELARKLETAEQAQRRLCQERRDQIPASALMPVGRGALEDKLDRLTADVQKLTERIWLVYPVNNALSTDKSEPRRRTPLRCWHCRQPGHVRRECPALQQLIRCRVSRIIRIQNDKKSQYRHNY